MQVSRCLVVALASTNKSPHRTTLPRMQNLFGLFKACTVGPMLFLFGRTLAGGQRSLLAFLYPGNSVGCGRLCLSFIAVVGTIILKTTADSWNVLQQ